MNTETMIMPAVVMLGLLSCVPGEWKISLAYRRFAPATALFSVALLATNMAIFNRYSASHVSSTC